MLVQLRHTAHCSLPQSMLLIVAYFSATAVGAESDADVAARLRETWERQRWEIATAEIQFLGVRRPPKAGLKRGDVLKLLDKAKPPWTEKSVKEFVVALDPTLAGMAAPWSIKELYFDGQNTREDSDGLGPLRDTHVRTERHDVHTNRINNQIDVRSSEGKWPRIDLTSLADLRFVPTDDFAGRAQVVARKPGGRVVLRTKVDEVVADEKTGFVYEFHRGSPQLPYISDIYQFGPTKFGDADNVFVLPTARFDAEYSKDRLTRFRFTAILAANLNVEVPGETFVVAGNKGATVVDRREGKLVERLEKSVPDVTKRD
jgi:hypothetical protein